MNQRNLSEFIHQIERPCIFRNILTPDQSPACDWDFAKLSAIFNEQNFTFRIGNRSRTEFENECEYIEATIGDFIEWTSNSDTDSSAKRIRLDKENPFHAVDIDQKWAYADYKYMMDLVDGENSKIDANVDSHLVLKNAKDSTLWIGTKGAYTPCHFDTYGYNLVAQIHGIKRWVMFPKSDSSYMYPVRVPFEESTVYSGVDVRSPDLSKYPLFSRSTPYVIELEPGDVAFIPHNWWHYVESLTDSISINTWVEMEIDKFSRLKEILAKTLVQGLMDSNFVSYETWLNPTEDYNSQEENLQKIKECLESAQLSENTQTETCAADLEALLAQSEHFSHFVAPISFEAFVDKVCGDKQIELTKETSQELDCLVVNISNSVSNPNVIDLIARNLLQYSK